MQNQKTLENLYRLAYADEIKMAEESEEELYHHGVLGMSWGDRHGPPYPLSGIDKKVARAEAKRKREKERRIKKLQRAAKKARRQKKRDERKQEKITKLKQKIAKKGDIEALKKYSKYFTNEEIQYIVERHDQLKNADRPTNRQLSKEERMENFLKRSAQFAQIAANAAQVANAVKSGADALSAAKSATLKDIERSDKEWGRIQKEFEMRLKLDKDDAKGFLDAVTSGRSYIPNRQQISSTPSATTQSSNAQPTSTPSRRDRLRENLNRNNVSLGGRHLRSASTVASSPETRGSVQLGNDFTRALSGLASDISGSSRSDDAIRRRNQGSYLFTSSSDNTRSMDVDSLPNSSSLSSRLSNISSTPSYNAGNNWVSSWFGASFDGETGQLLRSHVRSHRVTPYRMQHSGVY